MLIISVPQGFSYHDRNRITRFIRVSMARYKWNYIYVNNIKNLFTKGNREIQRKSANQKIFSYLI